MIASGAPIRQRRQCSGLGASLCLRQDTSVVFGARRPAIIAQGFTSALLRREAGLGMTSSGGSMDFNRIRATHRSKARGRSACENERFRPFSRDPSPLAFGAPRLRKARASFAHRLSATLRDKGESQEMPTVLRVGPYRFFFYAGDRDEPPHVHVERDDKIAKFWLEPVRLGESGGFNRTEMGRIQKLVDEHHAKLLEAWNDYFGS
jgi:hypothetical protein